MKTRGDITIVVLVVLGLVAASQAVPNFRPTNWFKKDAAHTQELAKAEADAAKARQEALDARKQLESIVAEQQQKTLEQVQYSQQMIAGIPRALAKEEQTAGVRLATGLAIRASGGLAAAIGDLPLDKQEEIIKIVDGVLSGVVDERNEALRQLAAKDAELRVISQTKASLEAQLPALQATVKAKDEQLAVQTAKVAETTAKVVSYADKAALKEKEAGSLGAQVDKLGTLLLILGFAYLIVHFVLPSLAADFPALQTVNKLTKSITSAHL